MIYYGHLKRKEYTMVTNEMLRKAVAKCEKMFNDTRELATKVRGELGAVFASVDEEFVYNVFRRNGLIVPGYAYKCEKCYFVNDNGISVYTQVRTPNMFTKKSAANPNGIIPFSYSGTNFNDVIRFGGDNACFAHFLMNDSAYSGKTSDAIFFYADANHIYNQLIAKTKYIHSIVAVLHRIETEDIPKLAEYVAKQYNLAVELDKRDDEEFCALFGDMNLHPKVSIDVKINVRNI